MRNPVVVITGAGAGVGRAAVTAFAERGARIGLVARDRERLEAAAQEVRAAGSMAFVCPTDVADAAAMEHAAAAIERALGPIDIWINVAMATVFGPFERITPEEFRRVTEVTYLGYVHGTMAALKRMRARNRGTIVQVGSALAYRSIPLQSAYCGAKAAIRGFTDSIRSELIHDRLDIHITMVQMPALNTPQFDWARNKFAYRPQPVPPIFQPEVAARAIIYAASARQREIYVGLPTYKAIYGNMLAPGFADRLLAKQGYRGQLTHQRESNGRPDNLFSAVPGAFGAHGRFDRRARGRSPMLWATEHRGALLLGLGALAMAALFGIGSQLSRRGRPPESISRFAALTR